MGTIEIENTTSGFHFTSERTGHPKVQIIKEGLFNYEGKFISRVFFGNEDKTDTRGVVVNAKMTSDKWGPVPFVIAYAEHFTPNSPKGESQKISKGHLQVESLIERTRMENDLKDLDDWKKAITEGEDE